MWWRETVKEDMLYRKPKIKIIVEESVGRRTYRVQSESSYLTGKTYLYKNYQKNNDYVIIPADYCFLNLKDGFKYIGKIAGNDSGASIHLDNNMNIIIGKPYWAECPGDNLGVLASNDIWSKAVKTLYGKKPVPWLMILIVIAIIVIAVIGYQYVSKQTKNNTKNTTTEQVK